MIDIKTAEQLARKQGGRLIGYHTIPMPVYQIMVSYDTFDDNTFFPIHKALLQSIDDLEKHGEDKTVNLKYLASMLGIDYYLVRQRFEELKKEHYCYVDPETGRYRISDDARRKFLLAGARPSKRVSDSLILDGKTFDFLPSDAYKAIVDGDVSIYNSARYQDIEAHRPVDMTPGNQSADVVRVEKALDAQKMPYQTLGLDHKDGRNFKVDEIEKKYVFPVYLVYVEQNDGSVSKLPYLGDVVVKNVKALANTDNFTFSAIRKIDTHKPCFIANLGYNANESTRHKWIDYADKDVVADLVIRHYGLDDSLDGVAEQTGTGWTVNVTPAMLKASGIPAQLLADCSHTDPLTGEAMPRCAIELDGGGSHGIVELPIVHSIGVYILLDQAIKDNRDISLLTNKLASITPDYRQLLVDMGRYTTLEEIDSNKYIHTFD